MMSFANVLIIELLFFYWIVHGKDLTEEIRSETSGDLQTTLIKLVEVSHILFVDFSILLKVSNIELLFQGKRSSSEKVDENLAYEDAKKLFEVSTHLI